MIELLSAAIHRINYIPINFNDRLYVEILILPGGYLVPKGAKVKKGFLE